jgi:hypothetical protein
VKPQKSLAVKILTSLDSFDVVGTEESGIQGTRQPWYLTTVVNVEIASGLNV